jgi:hypothetical protein
MPPPKLSPPMEPPARQDTRPDPDPTVRTSEQLLREISLVREVFNSELVGNKLVLESRLDGIERAIDLERSRTNEARAAVLAETLHLQKLHDEKFKSIEVQFAERDTRTEQTSRDSKVAVDAALQAAKEAVGEQNKSNALANSKMEAAFTKQIDQIGTLLATIQKTSDDKIDDLKSRVLSMESSKKGMGEMWGVIVGVGGLIFGALGIASRMFFK